ncbi:MAG: hypothetical protein VKK62_02715 [Synechococcaceae cyanobacterium]|nr:hypothetical protein [Synechococcaceae cyanobacterium]
MSHESSVSAFQDIGNKLPVGFKGRLLALIIVQPCWGEVGLPPIADPAVAHVLRQQHRHPEGMRVSDLAVACQIGEAAGQKQAALLSQDDITLVLCEEKQVEISVAMVLCLDEWRSELRG